MKVCAIIAEYNPFHKGHEFHIEEVKKFADAIVIILGSDITQRGEFASFNKFDRAKAALLKGASLVLELPTIFSCSCAEKFAHGAMNIIKNLNFITHLSFGSEEGNIKNIIKTAKACVDIEKTVEMKYFLKKGYCYPKSRQLALGKLGRILNSPNNILAVEYVKAAIKLKVPISFHTIKRFGAEHNSKKTTITASSSFIRSNIENFKTVEKFLTKKTKHLFTNPIKVPDVFIFNSLRQATKKEFENLPDATEGLHNRLFKITKKATSLNNFFNLAKTKRYTLTRLKRIAMYCFLNLNKNNIPTLPQYSFVLGFNNTGQMLLNKIKKSNFLVTTNFKQIYNKFPVSARIDSNCCDFVSLFSKKPHSCGVNFKTKPIILSF